jgi:hypothetical protein
MLSVSEQWASAFEDARNVEKRQFCWQIRWQSAISTPSPYR